MSLIEVNNIVKEFIVTKKRKGLTGALINLFHAEKTKVKAVDEISFKIDQGEIVGYIGPNGAGKSTTVKILSGILHPTSGEVRINGISPQRDRKAVVKELGVVFGQRSQLYWDLRLGESFELLKRIYKIDKQTFENNMELMDEILNIGKIINTPVRQLSLGQRMRGDLAAAILHSPSILFLDEPTIGLDVEAKYSIRKFILEINRSRKVTVILTTHDLDDVEQLCTRLMVINNGKIIEDSSLNIFVEKLMPYRLLVIDLVTAEKNIFHPDAEIIKQENLKVWLRFQKNKITAAELISDLIKTYPISDLSIKEPNIEDVIREIYKEQ